MTVHWMDLKVNDFYMRAVQTKLKMMMSIGCGHTLTESNVPSKVYLEVAMATRTNG